MVGLHLLSSGIERGCGLVGLSGVCLQKGFIRPSPEWLSFLGVGFIPGKMSLAFQVSVSSMAVCSAMHMFPP